MKILFLTPWYPDNNIPHHGIFIRSQVEALNKLHQVEVISSKIDYTSFSLFSFNVSKDLFKGFIEHRIIIRRSLPLVNQLVYFLITIQKTMGIAKKFQPDVIHGNIGYPGAFWAWVVGRLLRKPIVVTEHTRMGNNFRSFVHRFLTLFPLRRVNEVIAVSKWHAKETCTILKRDVKVIGNVIEFEKFSLTSKKVVCSTVQIGFLGGMNTVVKGLDILLEAIAPLKSDFKLHIGGEGKLLEMYKAMATKRGIDQKCIFYGYISPNEVPIFMSRLDFFVSPSRWETFGIAIVEALACGLPVIVMNHTGVADFITPSNGLVVPVENMKELQKSIERMISEYKKFDSIVIRELAFKNHSMEKFIQEINEVYSQLCSA